MNPEVLEILRGVFFWVMLVGVIGGYISLRVANRNRDRAAFVDYPENPEPFLLRARIAYAVFIVFLLAMIGGLGIVVFQILQVYRPAFNLPAFQPTATGVPATDTPAPTPTATRVFLTATPAPTRTPTPVETAVPEIGYRAEIGNTGFEGVNVRAGPGLETDIVARLSPGVEVLVLDEPPASADGYDWAHVLLADGEAGWIADAFLIPVD